MRRAIKTAILFTLLSGAFHALAYGQTHLWSQRHGGILHVGGRAIALDPSGNIFVTGLFQSTADFGGGGLVEVARGDIFLAKYNAGGDYIWSQSFGGGGLERSRAMAIDAWGNVVVTGFFQQTVDFGGGPLTSAGSGDIFVVKYDSNGNHVWSQRFGGSGSDTGISIAIDGVGNILVTGEFQNTLSFGGGTLTSAGSWDAFVAKFGSGGAHLWSRSSGDTDLDRGSGVAVDMDGNVVVTGEFVGTVDFGGGAVASAGFEDVFLAQYAPDGTYLWSKRFGQGGTDRGLDVAVDESGNILATGRTASGDFGGGTITPWGLYVARFDSDGGHLWSRGFHGNLDVPAIAVDGNGNVVVSGDIQTTVDFGGGALTRTGTWDIFVASFDPEGNHIWSDRFGDAGVDRGRGVVADAAGNILVTGHFQDTLDFGGDLLMSAGNVDLFIAKFGETNVAVAIEFFAARAVEGGVVLRGSFASILRVLGVNVYRAEDFGRLVLYENVADSGDEFYYEDTNVDPGRTYHYRIGVVDNDGEFFSQVATVKTQNYGTSLLQTPPNPFNPETTIRFPWRAHPTSRCLCTTRREDRWQHSSTTCAAPARMRFGGMARMPPG